MYIYKRKKEEEGEKLGSGWGLRKKEERVGGGEGGQGRALMHTHHVLRVMTV